MPDPRPTAFPEMDKGLLRGFERHAVPLLERLNRRGWVKEALHASIGKVNAQWIKLATGRLWQIHGFEHVRDLQAPRGLILVSNHRSFFDMYVASTVIETRTRLFRRVTYPVRSEFFYTHPLGVAINIGVSAASMWPPVFRDDRRRQLNPIGMAQMAQVLGPGVAIGIHPEGTRNKGPDPYSFLPLKPGLGHLLAECHPEVKVLPIFVAGLSSDALHEVRRGLRPVGQRGEPIRVRFGRALTAGEACEGRAGVEVSEYVMAAVREMAEVDRGEMGLAR